MLTLDVGYHTHTEYKHNKSTIQGNSEHTPDTFHPLNTQSKAFKNQSFRRWGSSPKPIWKRYLSPSPDDPPFKTYLRWDIPHPRRQLQTRKTIKFHKTHTHNTHMTPAAGSQSNSKFLEPNPFQDEETHPTTFWKQSQRGASLSLQYIRALSLNFEFTWHPILGTAESLTKYLSPIKLLSSKCWYSLLDNA